MVWTPELVSDFSVETLREVHAREVTPDNMTVYMIGDLSLQEAERTMIEKALKATDGNRTRAAEQLGISRRTLHRKINEYGLRKEL